MATRSLVKHGASVGKGQEALAKLVLLERAMLDSRFGNKEQNLSVIHDFGNEAVSEAETPRRTAEPRPQRSFSLHIGANLNIPGVANLTRVEKESKREVREAGNPFSGVPLLALAEYLGERMMPALEAVKEEQERQKRESKLQGRGLQGNRVAVPYVPPLLPVTRWASTDAQFRSTLVVEDGARQKARLSWYHPDDTMVPRDWFSRGLLEDLKYFNPFGLGDVVSKRKTED